MKKFNLLLLLLLVHPALNAEIYSWKDEHGNTHFGDRPPTKVQANDISDTVEKVNISNRLSTPEMMLQQAQEKEQKRIEASAEERALQQAKIENDSYCRNARQRLLDMQGRVAFYDEQGLPVKVTEKERAEKARQLAAEIKDSCS